jgi:ring-1,2-phenylacetyl-CoA epoxidase subunit PaaE
LAAHFHALPITHVSHEAAGAVAITFTVQQSLRAAFDFLPGQFLTLRTAMGGAEVRRSYSICSAHQRYLASGEIQVAIKPVQGGAFSRWAVEHLAPGTSMEAMPPDGRFTPKVAGARRRVGFAAGSGITPMLSIIASTLAAQPDSSFILVYCNQRLDTIMFSEALQDLKNRYPARLALIYLLSRQAQEVPLLQGRLDAAKVSTLLRSVVPADNIDEAFVCGPQGMLAATQGALLAAGVAPERIHTERFSPAGNAIAIETIAAQAPLVRAASTNIAKIQLEVVLDGKTHHLEMSSDERVLDVALEAGLDLPYSCRGGVCCTCRARVLEGRVEMVKNFTLEAKEIEQGFVLTCQAKPRTPRVLVNYDER